MPTPTDTPKSTLWTKFSRMLAGPRGMRAQEIALLSAVGIVAIAMLGMYVVESWPSDDALPEWQQPQTLREPKPAWTDKDPMANATVIHDDMLVAFDAGASDHSPTIYDLDTGEQLVPSREAHDWWISGDYLVILDELFEEDATVYDIHTGKKSHTIKIAALVQTIVVPGMLITVEEVRYTDARMRGIDVATGKEKWSKKLSKSWNAYTGLAPRPAGDSLGYGSKIESPSPIALLRIDPAEVSKDGDQAQRFDAIDVKTGKKLWSRPGDDDKTSPITFDDIQLTPDNDIHSLAADGTSHIIDAKTGEATEYPAVRDGLLSYNPLHENLLFSSQKSRPVVFDITTGKIVWRSKHPEDAQAHQSGVLFEEVNHDDSAITGTRAIDVSSGKTLWTHQEFGHIAESAPSDAVIATGPEPKNDDNAPPTQVFDLHTGKGQFQLDGDAELLNHNDDYLVFISRNTGSVGDISVVSRK